MTQPIGSVVDEKETTRTCRVFLTIHHSSGYTSERGFVAANFNDRQEKRETTNLTMTTTGVLEGRASVLVLVVVVVAAVVLCSGNLNFQAADAFQTRTMGFIKSNSHSSPQQNCATSQPIGHKLNCREGRLFLTVASSASAANSTSTDASSSPNESDGYELGDGPIPSEVFFPPMELNDEESSSETPSKRRRGRKRRAIQRMRENRFSRPIDSRLLRALLFPMVSIFPQE